MTIKELRQSGCMVRVRHIRHYDYVYNDRRINFSDVPDNVMNALSSKLEELPLCKLRIAPRGGLTQVDLTTPDGKTYSAEAQCSDMDGYNKKRGVTIALGRIFGHIKRDKNV